MDLVKRDLDVVIKEKMAKADKEAAMRKTATINRRKKGEITDYECKKVLLGIKKTQAFAEYEFKQKLLEVSEAQLSYSEYPLFFKNPDGRSALDTALDLNQIRSVQIMIEYIVKHQNSHIYHHLFKYNLIDLIQKRVKCYDLFQSKLLI